MAAEWFFPRALPYRIQGRGLAEDNFAQEAKTSLEILIREALQNPLDAPAEGHKGPIRVAISYHNAGSFEVGYLEKVLPKDYAARLAASGTDAEMPDYSTACILVIEDFGTTGLQGTFTDPNVDGERENWNAFWFREGEGAKSAAGSNGRAGQGKITYYRAGVARALFGFTVRQSDGKHLLMGRSSLRRIYSYGKDRYERDAFWCCRDKDDVVLPSMDEGEIAVFRKAFNLKRDSETGLSLVIPFAIDFKEEEAILTVLSEYYFPIARGRLEVTIGEKTINAENISILANALLPDSVAIDRKSSFTKGFRSFVHNIIDKGKNGERPVVIKSGWEKNRDLKDDSFPDGAAEELRSILIKGESIWVRCPLSVKPKKKDLTPTFIDVHLQVPDGQDRVEEAYIRRDLLIGSENHLAASYLQKARGLTLIEDSPISEFLADAEEPTHLKWNASRPRLAEIYSYSKDLVRAVRTALPHVLACLLGSSEKKDVKALARYFTKSGEDGRKHVSGGKDDEGKSTEKRTNLPPPVPKPFRLETGDEWLEIRPNGKSGPTNEVLPIKCYVEIAYEGLDLDPFAAYDPFDFDLSDSENHEIRANGLAIVKRNANRIDFEVTDTEFSLRVNGFDPNIRLRARLTYEVKKDEPAIDAE
jgi:hypothetical protein